MDAVIGIFYVRKTKRPVALGGAKVARLIFSVQIFFNFFSQGVYMAQVIPCVGNVELTINFLFFKAFPSTLNIVNS